MSRIAIPIGVDLKEIEKCFGSKDEALYNNVLHSECYKKFDEEFSFKKELYELIFNYVPIEKRVVKAPKLFGLIKGDDGRGLEGDWNDYGYALLTMCSYLGEKFSEDDHNFTYGDSWWKINTSLREKGSKLDLSRMHETKQIFDTPFEVTDIYTNIYTKEEVKEFSTILSQSINIDEYNSDLFYCLRKGLEYCADKEIEVVVFSYEV